MKKGTLTLGEKIRNAKKRIEEFTRVIEGDNAQYIQKVFSEGDLIERQIALRKRMHLITRVQKMQNFVTMYTEADIVAVW